MTAIEAKNLPLPQQAATPRQDPRPYDFVTDITTRNRSLAELENMEFPDHCLSNLWDSPDFNEWKLTAINGSKAPYNLPKQNTQTLEKVAEPNDQQQLSRLGNLWRGVFSYRLPRLSDLREVSEKLLGRTISYYGNTMSRIGVPELVDILVSNEMPKTVQSTIKMSFVSPPASYQETSLKRDAIVELELNENASRWVDDIVKAWGKVEGKLLWNEGSTKYLNSLHSAVKKLDQLVSNAPTFESKLLNDCIDKIKGALSSDFGRAIQEHSFVIPDKNRSSEYKFIAKNQATFGDKLFATDTSSLFIKPLTRATVYAATACGVIGTAVGLAASILGYQDPLLSAVIATTAASIFIGLPLWLSTADSSTEQKIISRTLGNLAFETSHGLDLLTCTGKLGELLTYSKLKDRFSAIGGGCYPEIYDTNEHHFEVVEAHNPLRILKDEVSVANDLYAYGGKVVAQTGANSGSKTYSSLTELLLNILAQNGCRIPALAARCSTVKTVGYQEVQRGDPDASEGRFGQELKRLADFAYSFKGPSIVVLDEVGQGTSINEGRRTTHNIVFYLQKLGCSVILNTHDFELVKELEAEGSCVPLMVEVKHGKPTYKFVPGIAERSHAHNIEKKYKVDAETLAKELAKRGIDIDPSEFPGEKRYS